MKSVKILFSLMMIAMMGIILVGCKEKDKNKITIAEVTHSVFYAPQYVALELGFFEEEGLDVSILLAAGADKTMAALLSRDAQIGLMGPEASIFVYNGGQTNYAINFAQLTKRDGSFLMARTQIENFTWDMLKNKEILGGRKGGVPAMTLEWVLKSKGLDVKLDDTTAEVNLRTDVQFAAMAGAFLSGEGDFVTLFEPTGTALEKDGRAYVIASIGAESGLIPYTAYCTTKSFMEENPEIIQKFTNAIYKGQLWVQSHTAREIAEAILPHFPDLSLNDLTVVMQRYVDIDAWCATPVFEETGFNRLMDVMEDAGELTTRAPFAKLVNNEFASKAIKDIKDNE